MYQLEYLDLEKSDQYEETIKKVLEQCFKEEGMEKSKIYVSKQILKKSDFSYHLYKDFGYWYLRYNLAYLKHKVLDKQF